MCENRDYEICALCGGCVPHCAPVESREEIPWEDIAGEEEPVITEEMISDHHGFNNWGDFKITYKGETYQCRYDSHKGTIDTEFPFKEALRKFWFMLEEIEAQYSFQNKEV